MLSLGYCLGVGVVWLRLVARQWLGVRVFLTALIAGAFVFAMLL